MNRVCWSLAFRLAAPLLGVALLWLLPSPGASPLRAAQSIQIVSVASDGARGDGASRAPSISGDGRFVAYESDATNLVPDDTNLSTDVFLHDLQTGATVMVSRPTEGGSANASSLAPAISADGRFVAFQSAATNLVPGFANGSSQVYVYDREEETLTRASISGTGF